jgi:hypothetical protein
LPDFETGEGGWDVGSSKQSATPDLAFTEHTRVRRAIRNKDVQRVFSEVARHRDC